MQREQDEFYKKLLPQLDRELQNKKYFGGDDITVADIQYYNEIETIVNLTKKELVESELPNLAQWFNDRMSNLPDLIGLDKKLKEIIAKYNFHWYAPLFSPIETLNINDFFLCLFPLPLIKFINLNIKSYKSIIY